MADSIDANYAAGPIYMRTATSELHAVTAYRHGEGQGAHHQGGHASQLAFNGQTVDRSPCSAAPSNGNASRRTNGSHGM